MKHFVHFVVSYQTIQYDIPTKNIKLMLESYLDWYFMFLFQGIHPDL